MKISKFAVFLFATFLCLGIFNLGSSEAVTITPYENLNEWEDAAGAWGYEGFESYTADTPIGNFEGSPSSTTTPGGITLQELGGSFHSVGANYIDAVTLGTGGANPNVRDVNGSNYVRAAIRDANKSEAGALTTSENIRLRILFDTPVNYFSLFFGDSGTGSIELALSNNPDPTDVDGYPKDGSGFEGLDVIAIGTVDKGEFFGFYSDVALTAVYFQTINFDPHAGETAGLGFGFDDVRWGIAKVPEPATMLLLGIGLIGLAGISRRRIRK